VCNDCKREAIDRYDVGSYRVRDIRDEDENCPTCHEPVGLWQDDRPVKAWEILLVENGEVREAIEAGFCSRRCALEYRAKHFGREAWEAWREAAEG